LLAAAEPEEEDPVEELNDFDMMIAMGCFW
jgi:hypothetical protein